MHHVVTLTHDALFTIILASALIPSIIILCLWIADREKEPPEPSDEQTDAACALMYSNYATLSLQMKETTRAAARAWLKAWLKSSEVEP